jgi:competence ComEA-like helix-hairpin-helix protein
MEEGAGKALVIVLIVSIITGAFVLIFDKTYRISNIIASNSYYYPGIKDKEIEKYAAKYSLPTKPKHSSKYSSKYKKYKRKYKTTYSYKKKRYKKKTAPVRKFSGTININTADEKELQKLPGISSATAKKIILFRKIKKGFKSKSDILKVPGFTEKMYNNIKDNITVE